MQRRGRLADRVPVQARGQLVQLAGRRPQLGEDGDVAPDQRRARQRRVADAVAQDRPEPACQTIRILRWQVRGRAPQRRVHLIRTDGAGGREGGDLHGRLRQPPGGPEQLAQARGDRVARHDQVRRRRRLRGRHQHAQNAGAGQRHQQIAVLRVRHDERGRLVRARLRLRLRGQVADFHDGGLGEPAFRQRQPGRQVVHVGRGRRWSWRKLRMTGSAAQWQSN